MAPSELVLTWNWTGCMDFQAHVHAALAHHCITTLGEFLWRFPEPSEQAQIDTPVFYLKTGRSEFRSSRCLEGTLLTEPSLQPNR